MAPSRSAALDAPDTCTASACFAPARLLLLRRRSFFRSCRVVGRQRRSGARAAAALACSLALCCGFGAGQPAVAAPIPEVAQPAYAQAPSLSNPLEVWLRQVQFSIPAESFDTPIGFLDLDAGTCTGLVIGGIGASEVKAAPLTLSFRLSGLRLGCQLSAQRRTLQILATAAVREMFLELAFAEAPGAGPSALPLGSVSVPRCDMDVAIERLEFTGNSSWVENLEANRGSFEDFARSAAKSHGCAVAEPLIQLIGSATAEQASSILSLVEKGKAPPSDPASLRAMEQKVLGPLDMLAPTTSTHAPTTSSTAPTAPQAAAPPPPPVGAAAPFTPPPLATPPQMQQFATPPPVMAAAPSAPPLQTPPPVAAAFVAPPPQTFQSTYLPPRRLRQGSFDAQEPLRGLLPAAARGPLAATAQAVDWATYPPLALGSDLVVQRSAAVASAASFLPVLNVPLGLDVSSQLAGVVGNALGATLDNVRINGINTLVAPSVRLNASGETIGLVAAIRHLQLAVVVTLHVAPGSNQKVTWGALELPLELGVLLDELSVQLGLRAAISEERVAALKVDQLQDASCLLGCAAPRAGQPLATAFGLPSLSVDAVPGLELESAQGLAGDLALTLRVAAEAFLRGREEAARALVSGGAALVASRADEAIASFLGSSTEPPTCPASTAMQGPGPTVTFALLSASCLALLLGLLYVAACSCATTSADGEKGSYDRFLQVGSRKLAAERSAENAGDSNFASGATESSSMRTSDSSAADVISAEDRLITHPAVPRWLAWFYPFMILASIFMFIHSQIGVGTTINVTFATPERETVFPGVFNFALLSSIRDSWNARAYLISVLTCGLTLIFPYIKLGCLLCGWTVSTRFMSVKARGVILKFVDEYGKYSLIDTFFALFAFAAYRIEWKGVHSSIVVEPRPGSPLLVFVFATILSLIMGHVAREYHMKSIEWQQELEGRKRQTDYKGRQALSSNAPNLLAAQGLAIALMVTFLLVLASACTVTFVIGSLGVAANLVADPETLWHEYSLISFGFAVTGGVEHPALVFREVQLVLFSFALVIPLLLIALLLVLWVVPLRHKERDWVLFSCRVLHSWASFDVFFLCCIIGCLELKKFAYFLVYNDNVAAACGWVRDNMHTDCFAVDMHVTLGFSLAAVTSIVVIVVPRQALKMCMQAADLDLSDQEESASGSASEGDESSNRVMGWIPVRSTSITPMPGDQTNGQVDLPYAPARHESRDSTEYSGIFSPMAATPASFAIAAPQSPFDGDRGGFSGPQHLPAGPSFGASYARRG
eukprot:TRINITY_DN23923_c0_g1_i3.p1 TRINITY_DN23923_c0_g1~~TRINITY_DN23923_c0_g1_i3.p1  ORF type:complete len:1312 (+),score=287.53 TRINITY_DN23923_c0_g1_i3:74-3937(+)